MSIAPSTGCSLAPIAADTHLSITTAQKVFTRAKARAAVTKVGGIHSLRHAYATHRLDRGLAVHELQRPLGHANLQSTQRYVHWLPGRRASAQGPMDLLADPRSAS